MQATIKAHPTALIAQDATLAGTITIGAGCIVHPRASILATAGPIELGENCVIEELAIIENAGQPGKEEEDLVLRIGHNNQFSVGCRASSNNIASCRADADRYPSAIHRRLQHLSSPQSRAKQRSCQPKLHHPGGSHCLSFRVCRVRRYGRARAAYGRIRLDGRKAARQSY